MRCRAGVHGHYVRTSPQLPSSLAQSARGTRLAPQPLTPPLPWKQRVSPPSQYLRPGSLSHPLPPCRGSMAMRVSAFVKPVRAARLAIPRCVARRNFATKHEVVLPDLPYDYGALAPVIIPEIMEIHHKKHHQAYVNGFNAAMAQLDEAASKADPDGVVALQSALTFNGGGTYGFYAFILLCWEGGVAGWDQDDGCFRCRASQNCGFREPFGGGGPGVMPALGSPFCPMD